MNPTQYADVNAHCSNAAWTLESAGHPEQSAELLQFRDRCKALVVPDPGPLDYKWMGEEPASPWWSDGNGWSTSIPNGRRFYTGFDGAQRYRCEMGRKDTNLAMIGPEPAGKHFIYELTVSPALPYMSSKVVAFQFWNKAEAPPRLSMEFIAGWQRLVWIDDTGGRVIFLTRKTQAKTTWRLGVKDSKLVSATDGIEGFEGFPPRGLTYPDGRVTSTFKWGNYFPAIREGYKPPASVGIEITNVSRKEVR